MFFGTQCIDSAQITDLDFFTEQFAVAMWVG